MADGSDGSCGRGGRGGDTALLYGFDPLCGWCHAIAPALRRVARDHPGLPIRPVMAGLVPCGEARPYAAMAPVLRDAAQAIRRVTGRGPSPAWERLLEAPDAVADSGPPCIAVAHVAGLRPDRAAEFAHRVAEAHFDEGRDLCDPATYAPLLRWAGVDAPLPDLRDPALADAVWATGRRIGLRAFPTLALVRDGRAVRVAPDFDPESLSAAVGRVLA